MIPLLNGHDAKFPVFNNITVLLLPFLLLACCRFYCIVVAVLTVSLLADFTAFFLSDYIRTIPTISKGGMIPGTIIAEGDSTAFEIHDKIEDINNQYYVFKILDGEYKGKSFEARNDSEDNVIWFFKDDLNSTFDCKNDQAFVCKMSFISYRDTVDSSVIKFYYYK